MFSRRTLPVWIAVAFLAAMFLTGQEGWGPPCTENTHCAETEFCLKHIGQCDGEGRCATKPLACLHVWIPVCGCDGQTYSNHCYAHAAGVSVAYEGECAAACRTNRDCPGEAFFCLKPVGECDGQGRCTPSPSGCPDVWIPVCGCDGQTYSNDCYAHAAGVSIDHEGECLPL